MRRRRRRERAETQHAERWLISYADFITLLFAFFVTLYGISTMDAQKLERAVAGFQTAFPAWQGVDGPAPEPPPPPPGERGFRGDGDGLAGLQERLLERLRALREDRVEIEVDRRGLVISVKEAASFATGRAELSEDARRLFREIGLSLVDVPNGLRVEGHTDDVPIHTAQYASNWELSTARATAVVALLVQELGLQPDRLSAAGYGEHHPRVPNVSDAARARNRRVDIVVLNAATARLEEPLGSRRADR